MKKAWALGFLGFCLASTVLLEVSVKSTTRKHASANTLIRSVVVSSSGQRLTSLLQGSPRDPRYSAKAILASRQDLPKCDKKPEQPTMLQSFFGSSVVHATCFITDCGGTGWVDHIDTCNTGGGCSGTYHNATTEPDSDLGNFQDRTHCGSLPECGCELLVC